MAAARPLLRAGTGRGVVDAWQERPECIAAAAHNGNRGNPCLFPARFFPELCALEADRGGSSVIRRHENVLLLVEAGERELFDCDTKQALEILKGNASGRLRQRLWLQIGRVCGKLRETERER